MPTRTIRTRSNRAGGVPLSDNIVRGGINYKINWLIANFLDQVATAIEKNAA